MWARLGEDNDWLLSTSRISRQGGHQAAMVHRVGHLCCEVQARRASGAEHIVSSTSTGRGGLVAQNSFASHLAFYHHRLFHGHPQCPVVVVSEVRETPRCFGQVLRQAFTVSGAVKLFVQRLQLDSEEPGCCRRRVLVLKRPDQGSTFWHHAKASRLDPPSIRAVVQRRAPNLAQRAGVPRCLHRYQTLVVLD